MAPPEKRRRLDRVEKACNLCRSRKVKCDGNWPCAYCAKRDLQDSCTFALTDPQQNTPGSTSSPSNNHVRLEPLSGPYQASFGMQARRGTIDSLRESNQDPHDTVVPLAAQLLRDAEGKVVFIGDCAPLSFLRAVRQLVTPDIDPDGGFSRACQASQTSDLVRPGEEIDDDRPWPQVDLSALHSWIDNYSSATSGLVDIFDIQSISTDIQAWARRGAGGTDLTAAVHYLVLAIGTQETDDKRSTKWFMHSKRILHEIFCDNMNIQVVQGYTMIALYMLRDFKPNGAYLFLSLASRSAYAIGLHRAEVNASFDSSMHALRDRIWKSLRVFDMFISCLLGRPPSISDVDDTVRSKKTDLTDFHFSILDASVSFSNIIEQVVIQVYSRKHISMRIAHFVSDQLKEWASVWLVPLMHILDRDQLLSQSAVEVSGALQVLCSYLYGITLLARPFLIYDVYDSLGTSQMKLPTTQLEERDKKKFADGAIDAAITMVTIANNIIRAGKMPALMPGIVSWLFAASLVLALGMLGRYGQALEDQAKMSIRCLRHFGKVDPHAKQYSSIVQALVETAVEHIRRKEPQFRIRLKQASSELFGLNPTTAQTVRASVHSRDGIEAGPLQAPRMSQVDEASSAILPAQNPSNPFTFPWTAEDDQSLQEFLRPSASHHGGFAIEDSFFPIDDGMTAFLSEGIP